MSETQSKRELILGEKFEKALTQAADVKNNGISLCRTRNKNNYMSFYDLILASRPDVQELMNKKGKQKTQAVIDQIKAFRSETSKLYKQVCDYLIQEEATEDDETKLQKNIKKISSVVALMNYIGDETIEKEFAKYGIKLEFTKMEDKNETFAQDHIRETMKNVFDNGKTIKLDLESENTKIKDTIYHAEVPEDLQYDKDTNPTGIKSSDFCKLVDIHAKMLRAKDNEEETEKIKTRAEKIAGEYVFQNARNELVNNKMTEFTT